MINEQLLPSILPVSSEPSKEIKQNAQTKEKDTGGALQKINHPSQLKH